MAMGERKVGGACAVVGPFPPPIHGMAKNTKIVADELERHVSVRRYDISPGSLVRGWAYHKRKGVLVARGLMSVARCPELSCLYIPSDAGLGMVYTALFLLVARFRQLAVFVHHRSFAYIDRASIFMRMIVWVGGRSAQHVFLCAGMRERFQAIYGADFEARVVSNAQHVTPISESDIREPDTKFTIGHLSNLSSEKGLFEVLGVFEALREKGQDCRLVLAGPASSDEARNAIGDAVLRYGELVQHRGSVWGNDKDAFYREIDVFLFPTKYKNEAQPNVVFEALSYAVPVVAYARGCVREDLNVGGVVVGEGQDYVSIASDFIEHCIADKRWFLQLKRDALASVVVARDGAIAGYKKFINDVVASVRRV